MTVPAPRSRAFLLLLIMIHAAWMYSAGWIIADQLGRIDDESWKDWGPRFVVVAGVVVAVVAVVRADIQARWLDIMRAARLGTSRAFVIMDALGSMAAVIGMIRGYFVLLENDFLDFRRPTEFWGATLLITSGLLPVITRFAARGEHATLSYPKTPFFLWERGHVASRDARIYLLAAATFVSLFVAATAGLLLRLGAFPLGPSPGGIQGDVLYLPSFYAPIGIGLTVGIAVTIVQGHWHRALGFVPWAFILLTLTLAATAVWPDALWPRYALGFAAGLPHGPLLVAVFASVPPRQRFRAMLLHPLFGGTAAFLLTEFVVFLPAPARLWALAALALVATTVFTRLLFRPFVELINEVVFRPMWYPIAYGPGASGLPTRGPVLIIGNHSAMFDPVWISGVVPLRSRAMMLSTFMDKPFLGWLTGTVYKAIRVSEEGGFRRHIPEIDEAVRTLQSGESVMIFPEAWIRRKEEVPMRRFAQGVVKIMQRMPQTPVVACWVEDGWGTYSSYKNGPPGKGKPFDILKRIRIGISEPETLPPEVLADEKTTRRRLMKMVLHARTYLGLPAHPLPGGEKEGEAE